LKKSEAATEGPWKTSFGTISESDAEALRAFLATQMSAPKLVEAKALFHTLGCLGCHKVGGVGGDEGLDLSRAGEKDPGQLDFTHIPGQATLSNWLAEHFRSPAAIVPGSQMPAMGLTENEVDALTMYVMSLRRRDVPGTYLPRDRVRAARFGEREFSADGATIFSAFCSSCHGSAGQGMRYPGMAPFPAIANPDFLEIASDPFITETVRRGRPGRRMPAWGEKEGGLRPEEIQSVVAYLRQMGGNIAATPETAPPRWVRANATAGRRLYDANCAGCHGGRGEGNEGPALNNKRLLANATDTYLVRTIGRGRRGTTMEGYLTPSIARAMLTQAEIESIVAFIRTWEGPVR
jgi:mono/diheme cytochrome c family protein